MTPAANMAREAIRARFNAEFDDGFRTACLGPPTTSQPRESGGYPAGFLGWSQDQRDAWFCGWSAGRLHAEKVSKDLQND